MELAAAISRKSAGSFLHILQESANYSRIIGFWMSAADAAAWLSR
ncbi:MAG TPA: hypothetical protein VMR33_15930 [Candidatus Baltobacteraceae bacterium]|jgi:hypothetical protein|nr:hypothetical protein [Candidatus Baltobacteraceae bacterium]